MPEALDLVFDLEVDAGGAFADLSDTELSQLKLRVNAGSASVTLPARQITAEVSVEAGTGEICVPDTVGLEITVGDSSLGSTNFVARGLRHDGNTWTRPGSPVVVIHGSARAGSLALNPDGGCGP